VAAIVVAFPLFACNDPLSSPEEAVAARAHLESLLDVMQENSINRNQINWSTFRSAVTAAAPDPRDLSETFGAIHVALGMLGDNHSSYTSPPAWGQVVTNSRITCTAPTPRALDVPTDIGYVRVAALTGSPALATSYANSLQSTIRSRDASSPTGWIVDLRGNTGGNMWPMIAGLGPILGERTLGFFIDPDGMEFEWGYRGGLAIVNNQTAQAVTSPYTLKSPDPKVAVLIDGWVASSGEAAAIAFKGRSDTRFFGTPTCGLSTANSPFNVDGARLNLTVAAIADRNRLVFGDTLRPDEVITDHDTLLTRAIAWLRGG
jgi:hypothetical protein